ncbi:GDSL-type esterase/lipase family protein [Streptomyces cellostaticus]|uniref:GDSL-type esterase/lipase family protein n=1 Tax=Streptomyces cellostaticus TaxID=67285 RepID=UPI00202676E8|nr:GDSL-type esterase/lipase family protein [Streptomyces cellostaticus]
MVPTFRLRPWRPAAAFVTAFLTVTGLLAAGAGPAHASPGGGPVAVVSMGDSYISGEAGRWRGNSNTQTGSRSGTDRAYTAGRYDPALVYGNTYSSGCDRSDSAEVNSITGIGDVQVNLACSGATTANVFRSARGGQPLKGEAPQADQLAKVAANDRVKLITLSIGGNDLGFADVIATCAEDYIVWYSYCHDDQQRAVAGRMGAAMTGVTKSIEEIRAVMSAAGYSTADYRIVLQSAPSPIPRSSENRYSQSGWTRVTTGGCPFWNADADWARDTFVPEFSARLKAVAKAEQVQFLDLQDMLQGREVCSKTSRLATPGQGPSAATSEWARFLVSGALQGTAQESFHPNYYAQRALGSCLTLIYAQASGNYACHNTPGRDATGMYLTTVT